MQHRVPFHLLATKSLVVFLTLLTTLLAVPAGAQDERSPLAQMITATRTSPFDPPTEDVFIADDGAGLDTGCTFNTDPGHPLRIDVMVDQAVGEVDGNGYLVNPGALISQGVIPASVEVILPAYDVDVNGTPPPESDAISLNGEQLGFLTGDDGIWKLNSFTVPVSKIKFPAPVTSGSPAPVANRVQINIDTLSSGRWCTSIDWVALVIPIKLKTGFKLEPTVNNDIRVRDYAANTTIDTIYDQSFDASCNLTTPVGPYDDYPFSGSAIPGTARLHATLKRCPVNDQLTPEVKVDWKVGSSLTGVSSWSGNEGDIDLTMPGSVGVYDVELTFTIDDKAYPAIHRKLFVTRTAPLAQVNPPRLGWYEKATAWATGQSGEAPILGALLSGEYAFGRANWRYGYRFGSADKCTWTDLVRDPISCDYADCFVFSDVLENMAATLGVGGLTPVTPLGTLNRGFLTSGAPSLDDAFPGSARRIGSSAYDRYVFSSHSLRLKGGSYYDATFNGIYATSTAFITANISGPANRVDTDGVYAPTAEGWKIYPRPGSIYDSWGKYDYKAPAPAPPSPAPIVLGLAGDSVTAVPDIEFTGNATYNLLDENLDGMAEALSAQVEVRLNTAGAYLILGTLEKGGQTIADRPAWESMLPVSVDIDQISGTYTVTLKLSGEQIYRSGLDGPYDLVLYGIASSSFSTATLATPSYDHASFGETPAHLTGVSEQAVDTDGDGKLDFIDVTLGLDVRLAGELRLQGALDKDGQTLVSAGTTQSLVAGAPQVTVRFDGSNLRRSGLDGPYDGSVNLIDSTGHTIDGIRFTTRPYSAGSFSAPIIPQGPYTDQGIDTNGNGLYDFLRIGFGAEIERAGSYRLTGVLRSAGSTAAVYADSLLTVAAGVTTVRLEFSGPEINTLALNGPYTVDVIVRDPATLEELDAVRLPQPTAAWQSSQFDPFGSSNEPIVLTGNSTDFGVDTNGNGQYDQLRMTLEVALARTDFYEWGARLVDRNGTELGFYTRRATLNAGVTNIDFVFDGETIGQNGVDGPYFLKGLLIFGRSGANLVKVDVAETQPYRFTQFEGAGDLVPPEIVVSATPTVLWPADHRAVTVNVADFVLQVTDNRDPLSVSDVVITRVTSDEPDDTIGNGDGSSLNDIAIAPGCRSVDLRAERAGAGNGRVYTIYVAVADLSGNVGTASYIVTVPHDASGSGAVDDGPAFTVNGCTP